MSLIPREPRYYLVADDDGRVRLTEAGSHSSPILFGHLKNLSHSGALLELTESTARVRFVDIGELVKIELAIPDRGRFAFFAEVVRIDPFGPDTWHLGLTFRDLPHPLKQILDRQVTAHSTDFSHPLNFELAARRGSRSAARQLTSTWLVRLRAHWVWLIVLSFLAMSLLAGIWSR